MLDEFWFGLVWGVVLGLAAGIGITTFCYLMKEASDELLEEDFSGTPFTIPVSVDRKGSDETDGGRSDNNP